jgi:transposase
LLSLEEWMDVKLLVKQGLSQREIARRTGLSRNTVARLVDQKHPAHYSRPARGSQLDPFKSYLLRRLEEAPLSAVRLREEIGPMGFSGSVDVVRRFLSAHRQEAKALARATVRFETPPGKQAQVDWAHVGSVPDAAGVPVKVYAFTMVLGFSRMLYVEFTTSMELPVLLACHQHAFAFFGGWTEEVLYDNMAQVKLPHSADWHPLFLDFAQHYGFLPRTCRVRRPRTKGKVERAISYLQDSFLLGRTFADLPDLQARGLHWLQHTANVRVHATTQRRPGDLFSEEKLTALATAVPYRLGARRLGKVSAEGYVHLAGSRYSVAPEHVGKEVLIEVVGPDDQRVRVRCGDLVLAEHRRAERPGLCIAAPEHVAAFWQLCMPPDVAAPEAKEPAPPAAPRRQAAPEVATTSLAIYAALADLDGALPASTREAALA